MIHHLRLVTSCYGTLALSCGFLTALALSSRPHPPGGTATSHPLPAMSSHPQRASRTPADPPRPRSPFASDPTPCPADPTAEPLLLGSADAPPAPPDSLEAWMHDPHAEAGSELLDTVRQWAHGNPVAAARWLEQWPGSPHFGDLLQQVALAWADADPAAALAWIESTATGPVREAALLALGYEFARSAPESALDLAAHLPPSDERDALLTHAARQFAPQSPEAALSWVEAIPEPELRQQLAEATAVALAEVRPDSAIAILQRHVADPAARARTAASLLQRWVQDGESQAPDEASAPVRVRPPQGALHEMLAQWAASEPEEATAWLAALSDPPAELLGTPIASSPAPDR